MAKVIVKPWVKFASIILGVAVVVFGLWWMGQSSDGSQKDSKSILEEMIVMLLL